MIYTHVLNRGGRGVGSPIDSAAKAAAGHQRSPRARSRLGSRLGPQRADGPARAPSDTVPRPEVPAMKLGLMLGYWLPAPAIPSISCSRPSASATTRCGPPRPTARTCSRRCAGSARTRPRIKLGTAVMQISARTPACVAMTATTIDHLSDGRLILGIGVSGPQVVEGWYGQPFPKPLARTREYVEILRTDAARAKEPLTLPGRALPAAATTGGAGLGKPLKLIMHPLRADIPIYLGAEGPKNVALADRDRRRLAADLLLALSPRGLRRFADGHEAGLRHRVHGAR